MTQTYLCWCWISHRVNSSSLSSSQRIFFSLFCILSLNKSWNQLFSTRLIQPEHDNAWIFSFRLLTLVLSWGRGDGRWNINNPTHFLVTIPWHIIVSVESALSCWGRRQLNRVTKIILKRNRLITRSVTWKRDVKHWNGAWFLMVMYPLQLSLTSSYKYIYDTCRWFILWELWRALFRRVHMYLCWKQADRHSLTSGKWVLNAWASCVHIWKSLILHNVTDLSKFC